MSVRVGTVGNSRAGSTTYVDGSLDMSMPLDDEGMDGFEDDAIGGRN